MAHWVKHLSCNCEDLSLAPQNSRTVRCSSEPLRSQPSGNEIKDNRIPEARMSASLVFSVVNIRDPASNKMEDEG